MTFASRLTQQLKRLLVSLGMLLKPVEETRGRLTGLQKILFYLKIDPGQVCATL